MIPWSSLVGLEMFRAFTYSAWIRAQGEWKTITREKLSVLWSRSSTCLRRWERVAGIELWSNVCHAPSDSQAANEVAAGTHWWMSWVYGYHPRSKKRAKDHVRYERGTKDWRKWIHICWQLPNSYHSGLEAAAWGLAGKIRRLLRSFRQEGGRAKRLFHRTARSAKRSREAGMDAYRLCWQWSRFGTLWAKWEFRPALPTTFFVTPMEAGKDVG